MHKMSLVKSPVECRCISTLVTMFTLDIDTLDYITYMIYALDICSTMGGWLSSDEPVTLESGFLIDYYTCAKNLIMCVSLCCSKRLRIHASPTIIMNADWLENNCPVREARMIHVLLES